MSSYYCVVRFVPSALAEEFANIGVLTFGDGRVRGQFLENWHRVQKFSTVDVNGAREFQEWVEESMVTATPKTGQPQLDEDTVRRIANEWAGSVQLSEPRASLLSPDELLEHIAPRYLIEPPATTRMPDKRKAVALAQEALAGALKAKASSLHVQTRRPLEGVVKPRVFDVVVSNGVPKYAVQCFSFRVADTKQLEEHVDAVAFGIEDVRRKAPNFPIAVVALSPDGASSAFAHAKETFAEVKAEFVTEPGLDDWSESVADILGP